MQKIQATVPNNGAFVWTLDFSTVAAVVDMTAATVRMWIKTNATDTSALLCFATSGGAGTVIYDSTTKTCQFLAPNALIAGIAGIQNFDIRIETAAGNYVIAFGQIAFAKGITTAAVPSNSATGSGLDDTVSVLSSTTVGSTSMAVIPISFSSAFVSLANAWLSGLPVYSGVGAAPVETGQWFINNGRLEQAQ